MAYPLKLGVNIDHVATIRQARGTEYPDLIQAARLCARAGAAGLTVHLREDRRHIQDRDVYALKKEAILPLNLEMAVAPPIVSIALDVCPEEVCLVPEKRQELTTEGGLDVIGRFDEIQQAVGRLQANGSDVSLFVEADEEILKAAADTGARVVELHTGSFCDAKPSEADALLNKLVRGAEFAHALGLRVNAGHGIHLGNLPAIRTIPWLDTLNIGHSIVSRALFIGLEAAVREMLDAMRRG